MSTVETKEKKPDSFKIRKFSKPSNPESISSPHIHLRSAIQSQLKENITPGFDRTSPTGVICM